MPFHDRLERGSLALSALSQAQQGSLTGVSFAVGQADAVATSSSDGSVCVWSMQVRAIHTCAHVPTRLQTRARTQARTRAGRPVAQ
jgi:hypothetical protein